MCKVRGPCSRFLGLRPGESVVAEGWLPLSWSMARFDWKSASGAAALQKRSGCAERKKKGGTLPGKNERDAKSAKGRRYRIRKIEEAEIEKRRTGCHKLQSREKKDRQERLSDKLEVDFGLGREAVLEKGAQAGKPVAQTAIGIKKDRQECLSHEMRAGERKRTG